MCYHKLAVALLLPLSAAAPLARAQLSASGPDAIYATKQGFNPSSGQLSPLMSLLDQVGVGHSLEAANIRLFGHIEGSYTWNFDNPARDLNVGRVFDLQNNRVTLNQLDFNIERPVDLTLNRFDVGGRVEMLYGSDSRFIHSNGLLDTDDFFNGPEYQFDLPQAYLDVAIPIGNGLRVRAGKFLFFKQIDPSSSVFYSHSFSFGAALPFTLTGVTGYYPITKDLTLEGGISRGWDQSIKDNNGAIDGLFRVRGDISNQLSLSLAAIVGPEEDRDNTHYRETLDFTVNYAPTDQLTFLLDAVIGTQARSSALGDANWYGISGYAVYRLNEFLSLGARVEWYRDEEGFTTALSQTLYEATVGLTITPFPRDSIGANFRIRPELRGDYSSRRFFDALSRHDQWTFALDAIFDF
ncbi:MAG TPA: outer membrane beta-barrel protein [Tepidisphaeraceae bacterium]